MSRQRVEKGNFRRKVDYAFVSALTKQPKLARVLRDWDTDLMLKFICRYLNEMMERS